jgi:cytochrome P450
MTADVDVLDLIDPARYARSGYPHEAWTRLRAQAPVAYFSPEGWEPFWAITKHADILEIVKQPLRFSSAKGITLVRAGVVIPPSEILVMLDPPKHGPVRRVANARFTLATALPHEGGKIAKRCARTRWRWKPRHGSKIGTAAANRQTVTRPAGTEV